MGEVRLARHLLRALPFEVVNLALTLATGGVFDVTAYATSRRGRELAIRLALEAQRHDLFRLVLGSR